MSALKEVRAVRSPDEKVIKALEDLLAQARAGEIIAVACAYEMPAGYSGHVAAFGAWSNRTLLVGKLQVMAADIVMNECLEWSPG